MVALKKENPSSLTEFNRIVDGLWPDDTIGHFFIVDIKFSNINLKTLVFNELYPPIFEKNKKMTSFERSTLQLLNIMVRDENMEKINSLPFTSKTKSTLKEKKVYTSLCWRFAFFDN